MREGASLAPNGAAAVETSYERHFIKRGDMTNRLPANVAETEFDLVIIGAGINGAGIGRDAAMRGLRVLLVDKGDIGGGTTSWSTRLIHGGLRYLQHRELRLVRESLREREILLRIAPHLVRPLTFLIPIYESARRGPLMIRAGMFAYDLLSFDKSLPAHRILTREEALRQLPELNRKGLRGAAVYHDAQVEFAERLAVENVLAAKEYGAVVLTYARVRQFIIENDIVRGVGFTDEIDGTTGSARGRIVVNASGPWVDQLLEHTGRRSQRLIGGTKGSHIIVGEFAGAPASALYVEAQTDQRPFFIIPWNGNYLIGTTDIRYEGDLDRVKIDESEIDYLLSETNRVIPAANLAHDSILFTYSGVRPLPYISDKDEQSITRRHFIREQSALDGLLSIVGGKLTTYRNLAEQTVELVSRKLGRRLPQSMTAEKPLPGAQCSDFVAFSDGFKRESGLPGIASERLLRIYGTRAREVLKLVLEDRTLAEEISTESGAIAAEVVFSFEYEMARTLTDCLLRRTMVGLNSSMGARDDEVAARVAHMHLGWSKSRAEDEVRTYRRYIERFQPRPAGAS